MPAFSSIPKWWSSSPASCDSCFLVIGRASLAHKKLPTVKVGNTYTKEPTMKVGTTELDARALLALLVLGDLDDAVARNAQLRERDLEEAAREMERCVA